ncbi:DUF29 domain-containing protein [Hansschlegelia quercus]|uniref:DUF29 domain-containing protein n=1 Tax=Hansschlegelia quercus TaxID=2528245 RepID=A0A4V2JE03_9HYPH|nr:DUF29 domain-containing protein [Hansschlegelia quercus]TBN53376.1 DUF29 domain-containing protein [Hansschlegelia quercus]
MSDVADYDTDILLWSERQAALLRELKTRAPGLPNDLDLENVAEEIESVGRSQLDAVESFLRLIFLHLIKLAYSPDPALNAKWIDEIIGFHADLQQRLSPAMRGRIAGDKVWVRVVRQASASFRAYGDEPPSGLPLRNPLEVDLFLDERELDIEALVTQLRQTAD